MAASWSSSTSGTQPSCRHLAGASGRSPGRGRPGQHLHLSALRPRRAFIPRGRSRDRAGRRDRPCLRGRWASRGVLARSHPATDPRRNARDTAGVTDALWACTAKAQHQKERSRVEGHRDGPFAAGGRGRPYGPPGRRSCGLPVLLPQGWRTWASWAIPHVPVNRACAPRLIPRLAQNCTRGADEQAEIHRTRP
jgi:hypothetical protein